MCPLGLRCVAAIVYNDCGEPLAASSVSGMTLARHRGTRARPRQTVRDVAAELTVALGGMMPGKKKA
jgi:IclR family transcriptional regulator, acetate operon repressor